MSKVVLKLFSKRGFVSNHFLLTVQRSSFKKKCLFNLEAQLPRKFSTTVKNLKASNENDLKKPVNEQNSSKAASIRARLKEEGYVQIYRLDNLQALAAINKLKWQLLYATLSVVPFCYIGFTAGVFSSAAPIAALCVGSVFTSSIWLPSFIAYRTVGIIHVSPDRKNVCISYIDNKGRRQDDIFPTDDLVPLSDSPANRFTSSWWVHLMRYSKSDKESEPYRLFIQFCDIKDKKCFAEIFGCGD